MSETRRAFLVTLGAAFPVLAARKQPVMALPNIVLVIADELPAGMLGCYGNHEKTPNLDALARRGVRFQNALATSRGGAVGRSVLLSGRTPMQGTGDILLTDLLSAKGYDVGFVGAWGLGKDTQPGHGIRWAYTLAGDQMFSNGEPAPEQGDAPAILTRRGVQFLDQQKSGTKPFLLVLSNAPSTGVAGLDNQVMTLVAKLRERNLEENTMIIFTSAGGTPESLNGPLLYCWPGHAPVEASRPELVGTYDFLSTICAAAQITPPDRNLCGRSYLPLVQGRPFPKKTPWRTITYGSFANSGTDAAGSGDTASDNRYRLVLRNEGKGPNQLFDLRLDASKNGTNQYPNRAYVTTRDLFRRGVTQWKSQYSR